MIHWLFIVFIAIFFWSIVNISDQYLVAKYSTGERTSAGLVLFGSFIGIFIAGMIGLFTRNLLEISLFDKLLLMLVGSLTILWVVFYLFALELGDVSIVVPWFLMVPVFGYILGYLILGEFFSLKQIIGSIVVLLGGLLIVMDFSTNRVKFMWKPALYMIIACFFLALTGILFKYVTIGGNFWVSSFWEYIGFGLFGILVYIFVPKYRKEFHSMLRSGGRKIVVVTIFIESLTIGGNLLNNFAVLLAPVAMVYLLQTFQPVIVLVLTILLTLFLPNIIKENLSGRVLIPKIMAIVVMIGGSAILFS